MRGDLVGDDAGFHVVAVGQAEVFLRGHVTEHRAAEPPDHRGPDAAGDVVVAGGHVGGQGSERVEGRFVAPLQLLVHVLLDHVHGHMARALVHHLHAHFPRAVGQAALRFEFGELRLIVGVGNGTWAQPVSDGKADVIGRHDFADLVPVRVEEVFLVVGQTPFRENGTAPADDPRCATGRQRDERQEHARVDRKIVDALLCLFDQGIPVHLP